MTKMMFYIGSLILSISGCLLSAKWMMIWLWIELSSLALIPVLSAKITPRSMEATSKYFLFQAAGSVFLLLGILARYAGSGNLFMGGTYSLMEISIIIFALTMKMGMFPKHFWFVDVMQGVNFLSGFFVAMVSKMIPVYIMMVISSSFTLIVLKVVGVMSVIMGAVFGVQQTQLRKLMALSSVAHLGWMMILFTSTSSTWLGTIFYLAYVTMVTPLFWMGEFYSIEHLTKSMNLTKKGTLKATMCLTILSMAGFPPLLGFFYKWLMFLKIMNTHSYLVMFILMIASLLSLYYYMQMCMGFYITSWPTMKSLFNTAYERKVNTTVTGLAMVIMKLSLYFLMWTISPLSSYWAL